MVQIAIDRDRGLLIVQVEGLARLITPRYRVVAPLEHVVNAMARPEPPRHLVEHLKTLTGAGTHIPGVLRLGTFIADDGCREFYALRDGKRAVVIELVQEPFRRLIIEPCQCLLEGRCCLRVSRTLLGLLSRTNKVVNRPRSVSTTTIVIGEVG